MANIPMNPSNPTDLTGTNRDRVYIATIPLRAAKGPAQLLLSAAYSINVWQLQHFMLILKPSNAQGIVFDFQPHDPEDIYVALAAVSGRPIPGTILRRQISRLPKKRCWYIGLSKPENAEEAVNKFNSSWLTDLRIGTHDCRHYTNDLAEILTGDENVVGRLRSDYTN